MHQTAQPGKRGSYTANLLGNIRSHLAGLQGYDVMALELIQNADDAKAEEIVFDITHDVGQIRSDCRRGVAGVKHAPSGFHCCPFGRTVADFTVLGWSDGAALGHDGPLTRPAGVSGCPSCAEGGVARLGEATRRGHSGGCCARAGVGGHLEEVENPSRIPGQATHGLGDGEPARLDEADGEAA